MADPAVVREFSELKEECILLNTAYIETSYPVHWPTEYTRETTMEARDAAVKIAQKVREGLGASVMAGWGRMVFLPRKNKSVPFLMHSQKGITPLEA